jgi:cobalt transporter subunit CbtA
MRRMTAATPSPFPATEVGGLFRRVLFAGILAGLIAGMLVTAVQAVKLTPLILAAETFEKAEAGHDHGAASEGADGLARRGWTLIANLLVGSGFGLILAGAFALRQARTGETPGATTGLLWGVAGFAAFAAAPALSLPPELPGSVAADLVARQAWWLATALATVLGLAALAYGRTAFLRGAGALLLAAPHLVGAPLPPAHEEAALPAELAARFAAASLVTAALFWAVLGWVSGWLYRRLGAAAG